MQNYYKSALDKVKLEDAQKDKVRALYFQADNKKEENPMKVKKIIRRVAAVAAAVALIFTANTVISNRKNRMDQIPSKDAAVANRFAITAYAKELTESEQVYADAYESAAGGMCSSGKGKISFEFLFPLECKGENIDTITYKIQNGAFQISNPVGRSIVVSGKEAAEQLNVPAGSMQTEEEIGIVDYEYKQYQSFTVDYDHQTDEKTVISIVDTSEAWDQEKLNEYIAFDYDIAAPENIEQTKAVCDFLVKDFGITCTVAYKDGATETKEIVISNKVVMMSELEDIPKEQDWAAVVRCFGIR